MTNEQAIVMTAVMAHGVVAHTSFIGGPSSTLNLSGKFRMPVGNLVAVGVVIDHNGDSHWYMEDGPKLRRAQIYQYTDLLTRIT